MQKKVNWGLSIILALSIISFILISQRTVEKNFSKYGMAFNSTRDSLGISKIKNSWIIHKSNDIFRIWGSPNKFLDTVEPHYFMKTQDFRGDTLVNETDSYHYDTDDTLAFRVVYKYNFDSARMTSYMITYFKGKYPPTTSFPLTIQQADSVLERWGLQR